MKFLFCFYTISFSVTLKIQFRISQPVSRGGGGGVRMLSTCNKMVVKTLLYDLPGLFHEYKLGADHIMEPILFIKCYIQQVPRNGRQLGYSLSQPGQCEKYIILR